MSARTSLILPHSGHAACKARGSFKGDRRQHGFFRVSHISALRTCKASLQVMVQNALVLLLNCSSTCNVFICHMLL